MEETFSQRKLDRVWRFHRRTGSTSLRNFLIKAYLPLVEQHSRRLRSKLPSMIQAEDLLNAGVLGLMDAIAAYDPDKGVKFSTFSSLRISGAMLDELRSNDWVPRLVRTHAKKLAEAGRRLQGELGRDPTDDELMERLGVTHDELKRHVADANPIMVNSLTAPTDGEGRPMGGAELIIDRRAADPQRVAQRESVKELVTKGLSRAERLIILLYYYEGLTLGEIGLTLDLSESRISQMRTSIIARLRSTIQLKRDLSESAAA